jgi:hypothetical protein
MHEKLKEGKRDLTVRERDQEERDDDTRALLNERRDVPPVPSTQWSKFLRDRARRVAT